MNAHPTTAALAIDQLAFAYPGADVQLVVPSFHLAAGEQALLVGGSGTGKSTLLQLIAGLRDPQSGSIRVAGVDITRLGGAARDAARGAHIGVIFQTFNLLAGFSALDNVLMALMFSDVRTAEHEARARSLLRTLDMRHEDQDVATLSVGQQQRVAVARALAAKPELVLADEPTASLDPANASAALDLIQHACKEAGAALLCTSHDPSIRERFARVQSVDEFLRPVAAGAHS
ncbi:MAG: ATP-binding cassette domain-containing protein [Phycisphaerae bacterium]|nr:ATP-binding cassette domain-containing protein [Phycisphaerae bacterium]